MGGYNIDCHMGVLLSRLCRPKARNKTSGDALTKASTTPFRRPAGDIAGASAMKTLTLSFNRGCVESAAKAWAVPWENPM